jgi:hypothetical protein
VAVTPRSLLCGKAGQSGRPFIPVSNPAINVDEVDAIIQLIEQVLVKSAS